MDDEDLVARARAGDLEAASTLLSRFQDVAYTVALRLLGQPSDAEDVAQDALVRAYTHLAELELVASFPGRLRRIAIYYSLNVLRRRGQLQFQSLDAELRGNGASASDRSDTLNPTPEDTVLASALRAEMDTLLAKLPAEQRVAVVLRDMYDYDVAEVATLQQCGLSAAKMRIMRGRTLLRRLMIEARVSAGGDS